MAICTSLLASCAATETKNMVANTKRSKEYFAESEYGVKASPRVSWKKSNLPRGGGRDQIGKPYTVRGKMYYPKEDKNYRKSGLASWYGDAFHGRLTANGEIYDTTHLTAAHPTMPLPSYARVTNKANGNSVIVRVNDRGPYSHGRLIDLSRKAAEMLDYTQTGTANVEVKYIGRAPLDGNDDQYLMASYRPGNKAPDPSDGLPTGVMIAMDGSTPSGTETAKPAFPGVLNDVELAQAPSSTPFLTADNDGLADLELPAFGPIVQERPDENMLPQQVAFGAMSYAPQQSSQRMSQAFAALGLSDTRPDLSQSTSGEGAQASEPFVAAATVTDKQDADRLLQKLSRLGRAVIDVATVDGKTVYSVNVYGNGSASLDDILEAAWQSGAPDAIVVRD